MTSADFIRTHLPLAAPTSGLRRLTDQTPYGAYVWAGGGAVLARYLLDHPESVQGRSMLDLGAGSWSVGIVAAHGTVVQILPGDVLFGAVPQVDLILVGRSVLRCRPCRPGAGVSGPGAGAGD